MPADLTRETTVALDDDDVAQDEEPPTPTSTGTTVRRPAATAPFPPASGPLLSRASTTASEQAPASRRLTSSTTFLSASAFEADDEYSDGDADFADGHYARLYRRGAHDHHIRSGTKTSSTSDGATRSRTDSGSTTAGTGDTMSPGGRRNGGIGGGGIDGEEEAALARPALAPRYHGEDVRPTSSKELAGWYMYAFAAETYVICGKHVLAGCSDRAAV